MKHIALPLLWIVIIADAVFWYNHDAFSDEQFWLGENSCYTLFTAAFLISVKYPAEGIEKKAIILTLWGWIPYCLWALWKTHIGQGSERSPWDAESAIISGLFIIGQIIFWWHKAKRVK